MKELIKRLSLPTSSFFIKVKNIGGTIAAVGVGIMGLSSQYEGSRLLNWIAPYAIELVVAGAVMALVAQTTVKPEVPHKELEP